MLAAGRFFCEGKRSIVQCSHKMHIKHDDTAGRISSARGCVKCGVVVSAQDRWERPGVSAQANKADIGL